MTINPDANCLKLFRTHLTSLISREPDGGSSFVVFNGEIIGCVMDPVNFVATIRQMDALGEAPYHSFSVYHSPCENNVYVHTDDGLSDSGWPTTTVCISIVRPLLCHAGMHATTPELIAMDVSTLLERKWLRFVDAAEIITLDVALSPAVMQQRQTPPDLLEVHAHLMLGVTAGLIPLLQTNQSPRNAYHPGIASQTMRARKPPWDVRPSVQSQPLGRLMDHQSYVMHRNRCAPPLYPTQA